MGVLSFILLTFIRSSCPFQYYLTVIIFLNNSSKICVRLKNIFEQTKGVLKLMSSNMH